MRAPDTTRETWDDELQVVETPDDELQVVELHGSLALRDPNGGVWHPSEPVLVVSALRAAYPNGGAWHD